MNSLRFKRYLFGLGLFLLFSGSVLMQNSHWGFFAHRQVNKLAIYALPNPIYSFFRENEQFISDHAIDPDKRRHSVKNEAEKHYIDLDHYGDNIDSIKSILPLSWTKAIEKFTEDSLREYGIAPWNAISAYYSLVEVLKNGDKRKILKSLADFGHYIGDIHVPLHTTKNYNGQLSGQDGIHGFWESRLPELYFEDYNLLLPKPVYVENINQFIFDIIYESHRLMPTVLAVEAELRADKKFQKTFESRSSSSVYTYSKSFAQHYHDNLDGMVENRLRDSAYNLACLWYSAWVDAGQPDMGKL